MRKVGLLVSALLLLLLGVSAQVASASPETGLAAICNGQGGTWEPGTFPTCDEVDFIIWFDKETSSRGSTRFNAADKLCKAAAFDGAAAVGGTIMQDGRSGFRVSAWFCT